MYIKLNEQNINFHIKSNILLLFVLADRYVTVNNILEADQTVTIAIIVC